MQQQRPRACALSVKPDTSMPITKNDKRDINDRIAAFDRYRHRLSIDQWHRDRQLSRDLAEVWDD